LRKSFRQPFGNVAERDRLRDASLLTTEQERSGFDAQDMPERRQILKRSHGECFVVVIFEVTIGIDCHGQASSYVSICQANLQSGLTNASRNRRPLLPFQTGLIAGRTGSNIHRTLSASPLFVFHLGFSLWEYKPQHRNSLRLFENMDTHKPIAQAIDPVSNLWAQDHMSSLATDPRYVIPGHDPAVFERSPRVSALLRRQRLAC
jgi:hypothetical protein